MHARLGLTCVFLEKATTELSNFDKAAAPFIVAREAYLAVSIQAKDSEFIRIRYKLFRHFRFIANIRWPRTSFGQRRVRLIPRELLGLHRVLQDPRGQVRYPQVLHFHRVHKVRDFAVQRGDNVVLLEELLLQLRADVTRNEVFRIRILRCVLRSGRVGVSVALKGTRENIPRAFAGRSAVDPARIILGRTFLLVEMFMTYGNFGISCSGSTSKSRAKLAAIVEQRRVFL